MKHKILPFIGLIVGIWGMSQGCKVNAADVAMTWDHPATRLWCQGLPRATNDTVVAKQFRVFSGTNGAPAGLAATILVSTNSLQNYTNKLGQVSTNVFVYTFTNMPPSTYSFNVTAVEVWGIQSNPSNTTTTDTPGTPGTPAFQTLTIQLP